MQSNMAAQRKYTWYVIWLNMGRRTCVEIQTNMIYKNNTFTENLYQNWQHNMEGNTDHFCFLQMRYIRFIPNNSAAGIILPPQINQWNGHKGGKSATMRSWNFVSLLRTNPLKRWHLEQFNLQDKLQPKRKWIHQHHSPTSHEKKYNCSYHFKQQRNFYIQRELELLLKMWLNIISCDNENTSLFHDT